MILTAVPDCHRSTPPNYLELSLKEILNGCKRNIAYHCEKYWRKGREILLLIMILTVVPDCHRPTPPNYLETHPFKCRQRITEPYYWSISQMYLLRLSYLFVQIFKCICSKMKCVCLNSHCRRRRNPVFLLVGLRPTRGKYTREEVDLSRSDITFPINR